MATYNCGLPLFDAGATASSTRLHRTKMSACDAKSDALLELPDYVWIMILNRKREAVLMVEKDGNYGLPRFQYQHSMSDRGRISQCQDDLRCLFDAPKVRFSFLVELFGTRLVGISSDTGEFIAFPKLYLVEYQTDSGLDDITLPISCAWKNSAYIRSLLHNKADSVHCHVLRIVNDFVQPQSLALRSLRDPRYQFGWHQRASELLKSTVVDDGAILKRSVAQHHLTTTSTLLKVFTTKGWYYLKSPAIGSAEVSITQKVSSLFPECSPQVLVTSTDLNCFITRGFEHETLDDEDVSELVMELCCLQQKSLQHVTALSQAGCPVRESDVVLKKLRMWGEGKGITNNCEEAQKYCRELQPFIEEMVSTLVRSSVPRVLVHGDFYFSNATFTGEDCRKLLLFDWQFAYIGHPFLDIHRIHKDCSRELIDEYLRLWTQFGTLEDLRTTFDVAWKLGWLFKVWSLSEWYEACNPQWSSCLQSWMLKIVKNLYRSLVEEAC